MGLWEAVGGLEGNPESHRLVDLDMVALSSILSLTLRLLRTLTLGFVRNVDPRRE